MDIKMGLRCMICKLPLHELRISKYDLFPLFQEQGKNDLRWLKLYALLSNNSQSYFISEVLLSRPNSL